MTDRYSDRGGQRWEDDERRHPYESRSRERDWGPGGRDRGFVERAGDEVRSWFGDEEAQRRRMQDERDDPWRGRGDWSSREPRGRGEWGRGDWSREPVDRDWSRQWGYVEGRGGYGERPADWSRGTGSTGYGYSGTGSTYGGGYGGYGRWGRERDWGRERFRDWDRDQPWGGQGAGGPGSYGREFDTSRADWGRYSDLGSERDWGRERRSMGGPYFGRGPRNYQRSDERIREDICERLSYHGQLDPSDVEIQVQNGEVTLQGSVQDRWAKRTAEEIAEDVWGVKEVHNQLRVVMFGVREPEGGTRQSGQTGQTGQQRSNWAA